MILPIKIVPSRRVSIFLLFSCLAISFASAQTIEGVVRDSAAVVNTANVLLKDPTSHIILQYTSTDEQGRYSFRLKEPLDSVLLEVVSMVHEPAQKRVAFSTPKEHKTVNFLLRPRQTQLEEVVVNATKKKIRKNHDTVFYDPKQFLDGSEHTVADMLKKLPGIRVEEDGTVLYKGKQIEKMLLDNDDLFGAEYQIGTRNISANRIEEVEAISHFNDNPLLDQLIDSKKVALNLITKKGETDFSGHLQGGYGPNDYYSEALTGLLISKKHKFITTGSYNNIGKNRTPFNFQSSQKVFGNRPDQPALLAPEILSTGNFSARFPDQYHKMNHTIYTGFKGLSHLGKETKAKIGFDFYDDYLTRRNEDKTFYDFGSNHPEENFEALRLEELTKKPRFYNVEGKIQGKITDSLSWVYTGKVKYKTVNFRNHIDNNGIIQDSKANTLNFFTKHHLQATMRINKNSALSGEALFSYNRAPQTAFYHPPVALSDTAFLPRQKSRFDKKVSLFNLHYYHKKNQLKLQFDAGFHFFKNNLTTQLSAATEASQNHLNNHLMYSSQFPYFNAKVLRKWKHFKASVGLDIKYYDLKMENPPPLPISSANKTLLLPSADFSYKVSGRSKLHLNYSLSQKAPKIKNLYSAPVLTSYRLLYTNIPLLKFQHKHHLAVGYSYYNNFSVTRLKIVLHTSIKVHNYLNNTFVTPRMRTVSRFLSDFSKKNYGINLHAEQYIGFINARMALDVNYHLNKNMNIINNSNLRHITTHHLTANNEITKKLTPRLYLKNDLSLLYLSFSSEGQNNSFATISDKFKLSYTPFTPMNITFKAYYNRPNMQKNTDYLFLNFAIDYTCKNGSLRFTLKGHNLLNYTTYKTLFVSDYFKSFHTYNLIHRYVLASITYYF